MKTFWDIRYKEKEFAYGELPNVFFEEQLSKLQKKGTLLLPLEGEGRNAIYAAKQGWDVTAFDFSESGREKALELAAKHEVTINYQIADATVFDFPIDKFDAIALVFAHLPPSIRQDVHQKIAKALKPGGTLIIDSFHPNQLQHPSGGPKDVAMLYTLDLLLADFKNLIPVLTEECKTILDEGNYHVGSAFVTRLVATKP